MPRHAFPIFLFGVLLGGMVGVLTNRGLVEADFAPPSASPPSPSSNAIQYDDRDLRGQITELQQVLTRDVTDLQQQIQLLQTTVNDALALLAHTKTQQTKPISQAQDTSSALVDQEQSAWFEALDGKLDDPAYRTNLTIRDLNNEIHPLPTALQKKILDKVTRMLENGELDPDQFAQ